MRFTKIVRMVSVAAAAVISLAGLISQGVSLGGAGSIEQDYMVLNQVASKSSEASVHNDVTLADWQFTVRTRPPKCRFVE